MPLEKITVPENQFLDACSYNGTAHYSDHTSFSDGYTILDALGSFNLVSNIHPFAKKLSMTMRDTNLESEEYDVTLLIDDATSRTKMSQWKLKFGRPNGAKGGDACPYNFVATLDASLLAAQTINLVGESKTLSNIFFNPEMNASDLLILLQEAGESCHNKNEFQYWYQQSDAFEGLDSSDVRVCVSNVLSYEVISSTPPSVSNCWFYITGVMMLIWFAS